jgi:hypothetical protein
LFGGAAGVVACLLPALTTTSTIELLGQKASESRSILVARDWRGLMGLLGFFTSIVFSGLLYGLMGKVNRNLTWVPLGVGAALAVLSLWLLIDVLGAGSRIGFGGVASSQTSASIGSFLYVITAGVVSAGAFLKVREEKLL